MDLNMDLSMVLSMSFSMDLSMALSVAHNEPSNVRWRDKNFVLVEGVVKTKSFSNSVQEYRHTASD